MVDGFDDNEVALVQKLLADAGAQAKVVAPHLGTLKSAHGAQLPIDFSLLTAASVLFDAVYLPGSVNPDALMQEPDALEFIHDAFKHCKTIGSHAANVGTLRAASRELDALLGVNLETTEQLFAEQGVVVGTKQSSKAGNDWVPEFIQVMGEGRHWIREAGKPL